MKNTRIISLCLAIITVLALVGCNQNTPEETTESVITTSAPVLDVTEPEATEPEVTEPEFPEYAGPASDFKFSLASVLSANDFASYTDFLASSEKSFLYHSKLKPVKLAVLSLSLKEKRIRVSIGI